MLILKLRDLQHFGVFKSDVNVPLVNDIFRSFSNFPLFNDMNLINNVNGNILEMVISASC